MWNVDTTYTDLGYPGIVVGQYQSTLDEFHNWSIVPNPVPIWEEEFSPGTKSDRITICYTPSGNHGVYSNDHRLYWHSKGKPQTLKILDELSRSYNINISAILDRPVPHSTSLQMKRSAHIVIDECVTGSYHRNSLEGLSVGCVVVNGLGLKHDIVNALHRCTESDDTPFIFASLDTLYETLSSLIQRGSTELTEFGRHNREWMEDHWDFKSQWSTHWEHVIAASLDQTSTLD
jgi:hypothetical protein